jgi:hypothetical protein
MITTAVRVEDADESPVGTLAVLGSQGGEHPLRPPVTGGHGGGRSR